MTGGLFIDYRHYVCLTVCWWPGMRMPNHKVPNCFPWICKALLRMEADHRDVAKCPNPVSADAVISSDQHDVGSKGEGGV
jgi:hypothetical protein